MSCCGRCGREVHCSDQKLALGKAWHTFCFSCYKCRKLLDKCSVYTLQGELFCCACYQACICNPCFIQELHCRKTCCGPCQPCLPCCVPWTPPCKPCNPCEPCKPCKPCNPCDPCNPCKPCNPCDPCNPCNPCNPCDPCKPCNPCDPCNPCNPCDPCSPCGPCKPCDPCNPCNPCNPCCAPTCIRIVPCSPKPPYRKRCSPCNSPCGSSCGPCPPCRPCNPCDPCNPCTTPVPCIPCRNPCCSCCGKKICEYLCPTDNYCLRRSCPPPKCVPKTLCLALKRSLSSSTWLSSLSSRTSTKSSRPSSSTRSIQKVVTTISQLTMPRCRSCSPKIHCGPPPVVPPGCCPQQPGSTCAAPSPRETTNYYNRHHDKIIEDGCKGSCYCPENCCCPHKGIRGRFACPKSCDPCAKVDCCPGRCCGVPRRCCPSPPRCCPPTKCCPPPCPPPCSPCTAPYCPPPRRPICYPPVKCCEPNPCERICYYPCQSPCAPKYCTCGTPNPCDCDLNIKRRQVEVDRAPCCRRCGRKVYAAEKIMASGGAFHTCCFSCYCCHKPLEVTSVYENQGEIYCKHCYSKYFGLTGYGYGMTLQSPL